MARKTKQVDENTPTRVQTQAVGSRIGELQSEYEIFYRSINENSLDAILLTTPDGTIIEANPAACQMFGRTMAEIRRIGRNGLVDLTDPRLAVALEERALKGEARAEFFMIRADDTRFWRMLHRRFLRTLKVSQEPV